MAKGLRLCLFIKYSKHFCLIDKCHTPNGFICFKIFAMNYYFDLGSIFVFQVSTAEYILSWVQGHLIGKPLTIRPGDKASNKKLRPFRSFLLFQKAAVPKPRGFNSSFLRFKIHMH